MPNKKLIIVEIIVKFFIIWGLVICFNNTVAETVKEEYGKGWYIIELIGSNLVGFYLANRIVSPLILKYFKVKRYIKNLAECIDSYKEALNTIETNKEFFYSNQETIAWLIATHHHLVDYYTDKATEQAFLKYRETLLGVYLVQDDELVKRGLVVGLRLLNEIEFDSTK